MLNNQQPQEDYEKLLLLTWLFLGEALPRNKLMRAPLAFHHARWIAKAIYALKILLFRDNFQLKRSENSCIFIVKVYLKKWFLAPLSTNPPADLNYVKQLLEYGRVDAKISGLPCQKCLGNHL